VTLLSFVPLLSVLVLGKSATSGRAGGKIACERERARGSKRRQRL
jgi:hypothetical protein